MRSTQDGRSDGTIRTVQVRSADELFDKMWSAFTGPSRAGVENLKFKFIGSEEDKINYRAAKKMIRDNVFGANGCQDKKQALGFLNQTYRAYQNQAYGESPLDQLSLSQRGQLISGQRTKLGSVGQVAQVKNMISRGELEASNTKLRASTDSVKVAIVAQIADLRLTEDTKVRLTVQVKNPVETTSDHSYTQRLFGWLGRAVNTLVRTARSIDIRITADAQSSDTLRGRLNGLGRKAVSDFVKQQPDARQTFDAMKYSPFRIRNSRIEP